jgi:putative DNA primase/helicase
LGRLLAVANDAEAKKIAQIAKLMHGSGALFIRFKGAPYMRIPGHTIGMVPFDDGDFNRFIEGVHGGFTNNKKRDYADTIKDMGEDWSPYSRYIAFNDQVWDAKELKFDEDQTEYVYSTNYKLQPKGSTGYMAAQRFFLQLADGDPDLALDYQQGLAPIFMTKRPRGVIWFIGDGQNGKSALLYIIQELAFEPYIEGMTTADMEDGRDMPQLIGKLANVVNEASEKRVDDSSIYKSIGTHEKFRVHKFHHQTGERVVPDFHTIFNANNIPTFADKSGAARSRTWTVPFPAHFKDDPTFKDRTFTPEFVGGLLMLVLEATIIIRDNGNNYRWSQATLDRKNEYDASVNSAEAYVTHLQEMGILGFTNWIKLTQHYENWCELENHDHLHKQRFQEAMKRVGFTKKTYLYEDGKRHSYWFFDEAIELGDRLVWQIDGLGVKTPTPEAVQQEFKKGEW